MRRGWRYLKSWLNWLVPEWWPENGRLVEVEVEQREQRLKGLPDTDLTLRSLMHLALEQFQSDNLAAIAPNLSPEQRAYNAGRAAGIADLVGRIERLREERKREEVERLKRGDKRN